MTKSPQGVYVNEATHNRVSRLVANALNGHGTLAGFMAFVEEAISAATEWDLLVERNRGDLDHMRDHEVMHAFNDAPKDGFGASPQDSDSSRLAAKAALSAYEAAWGVLASSMPWKQDDARTEVAALFLLRGDYRVWLYDRAYDNPRPQRSSLYEELGEMWEVRHQVGAQLDELMGLTAPKTAEPTLIWRGNAVEALLEPAKNRSTSFYLDPEIHDLAIRMFGRELFERIERGLHRLLSTPHHIHQLEPHFNFLEHGTAIIQYQHRPTEQKDRALLLSVVAAEHAERRLPLGGRGLRWSGPLGYYLATQENSLMLALELGLAGSIDVTIGRGQTGSAMLSAFLERYRLPQLGPDRSLAYRVIIHTDLPTDRTFVTNAFDYHLLRLFQEYAHSVVPEGEQEESRTHPMTLATLAQEWVFPTKATLESYGNVKVSRTAVGNWEARGGRSDLLTLSDADAYWTAKALNAVLPLMPHQTITGELLERWEDVVGRDFPEYIDDHLFARAWVDSLAELGHQGRVKLPLGRHILNGVVAAVRQAGDRPDVVSIGVKLVAELTDEALGHGGKFKQDFMRRVSPFAFG